MQKVENETQVTKNFKVVLEVVFPDGQQKEFTVIAKAVHGMDAYNETMKATKVNMLSINSVN